MALALLAHRQKPRYDASTMTAKHNSKHARESLWVAKHRAASAKSDPHKHGHEARQHKMLSKNRELRELSALLTKLGTEGEAQDAQAAKPTEPQAATPKKTA
jgi:hypothetical protein